MQGPSQPLTQSPSAATPVRSAILTPANLPPDDIDWISNASFTFELLAGAGELDRTGIAKAIANIALPILKLAQNNKKARDELRDTINYLDEMLSYVSEEVELLQYGQSLTDASTRPLARLQQMGDEFVSQLKVLKDDLNMIYGETGFHAKMKKPFQSKAILDRVNQHKGYVKEARDRLVTTAVLSATRQIERIVEHLMGPSKMTQPVNYLPPRALPPIPAPRSPSPFTVAGKKQSALTPALGILGALNPHSLDGTAHNNNDSLVSDHGHSNRKDHFWAKDKHHESLRDDDLPTVTKMIGLFTATASENWDIVLEICECSSASDTNAKEAVRALRREFKYGEPSAQLSAARLWAIMLRNSTDTFISQSTSKKFLDTLEDVITSPRTSPVVRERVMDVVAAAAYASGTRKDTGFRALWRKVKSPEKPDEGIPFDADDAMFIPPINNGLSHYENPVSAQDPVEKPDEAKLRPRQGVPDFGF